MKNIYLLGECMIELMNTSVNTMKQSFAGDVYNTAVYLKRTFPQTNVHLVTAVGTDRFSQNMIACFKDENIQSDLVFQSKNKTPGLYAIDLDENGERSFTYWRENSAARQVMQHIDDAAIAQLSQGDMFFFSGISIAVIEPHARAGFWQMVDQLIQAGVQIVFDPNYRPRMWSSADEAQTQFKLAFAKASTVLPGIDDFEQLFAIDTAQGVIDFLDPYPITELIIKNGPASLIVVKQNLNDGHPQEIQVSPVKHVVDTTSAGDSFNGVYLGAKLNGINDLEAINMAAQSAAYVIQHKGAIVDKSGFEAFWQAQF
ncbi:sugar kinase [Shewanella waksmanii]|uniref:sugar kinase n=1 Tax=Shewanella waksmanii TaxID=213783 RepID=UPI00048D38C3|nr:sugar kinase [Shewanella waksmanii]